MAGQESSIQEWTVTEPLLNLHCELGESPYYEPATNTIRFVDIPTFRMHTFSLDVPKPEEKDVTTLQFNEIVSVTSDIKGVDPAEKLVIGAKYGLALLDRKSGKYEYLSRFSAARGDEANTTRHNRLRSNDGTPDPHGRFWLANMTEHGLGFDPEGTLYQFDLRSGAKAAKVSEHMTDMQCPNGLNWSADGKTMFFTNTFAKEVIAWDYNLETGDISNKRVWYKHEGPGFPDGSRIDVEGNMWHAIWAEGLVLRLSPEGKVAGRIKLPTRHITCVEFVGTELYISSAADAEGEPQSKELGGALFKVDVGVKGLPRYKFDLGQ